MNGKEGERKKYWTQKSQRLTKTLPLVVCPEIEAKTLFLKTPYTYDRECGRKTHWRDSLLVTSSHVR